MQTTKTTVVGSGGKKISFTQKKKGVGKSWCTQRFTTDKFQPDWDPTIEENYTKTLILGEKTISLEIIDVSGREGF
jgi:GTPase SAR1 family protein